MFLCVCIYIYIYICFCVCMYAYIFMYACVLTCGRHQVFELMLLGSDHMSRVLQVCIDTALRAPGALDYSAMQSFLGIDTQEKPASHDGSHRKPQESAPALRHSGGGSSPADRGREDRLRLRLNLSNSGTTSSSGSSSDEGGDADSPQLQGRNAACTHHEKPGNWSASPVRNSPDVKAREVWLPGYIDSYLEQPSVRNEYPRVHDFKPLQHLESSGHTMRFMKLVDCLSILVLSAHLAPGGHFNSVIMISVLFPSVCFTCKQTQTFTGATSGWHTSTF
jgi:hypothetical protein